MSDTASVVQAPFRVHDPTPYRLAPSSPQPSPAASRLFGGGDFAWSLSPSGCLSLYSSADGSCVSQLSLAPSGCRVALSCSCELSPGTFPSSVGEREGVSLLVLALNLDGKTMVVVVDPLASSRILVTFKIPWAVSSLCGVSGACLNGAAAGLFSRPSLLQSFAGVLAVGCAGGHVLLVDLALDASRAASVLRPGGLAFVESLQATSASVASARSSGKHACVDVLASFHVKKGHFTYASTSQAASRSFPVDSLAITALHFVPQILSLLIGYSVGGFQLYDIQKAAIVHSGPCPKTPVPVTHFMYQEPENDPKYNVYLWVARGNPPNASMNIETKLTLYQLLYAQKISNETGLMYQDFLRCCPGFMYPLTPTPSRPLLKTSPSSTLVHCRTVEMRRHASRGGLDESHDSAGHGPDLTVAVFVWRCGDSAHRDYLVGLFDLNQYYHSQVPKMLQWRSSGRHSGVLGCSYFAFYSLKKMIRNSTILDAAVLDVNPFPSSLPPIPETHMWPTSLSFNVTAITSDGFLKCSCFGLQALALEVLGLEGVASFSRPGEVFGLCERADLLGVAWDGDDPGMEDQQRVLLSVALEHHMTSLLKSCGHMWMDGGGETGFSVFLEWLRDSIQDMKNDKDNIFCQLFSGPAASVDKTTPLFLSHLRKKFSLLSHLLTSLLTPLTSSLLTDVSTEQDPFLVELSGFYVTVTASQMLIHVVIWCVENDIIPVATGSYFVYPARALKKLFNGLRSKMSGCSLCVDYLCEDLQLDYQYPGDSLEGLLLIFNSADTPTHHCLMMYFLCDLCHLRGAGLDRDTVLGSYSEEFRLPKQLKYLSRGLWSLDHMHYERAVGFLNGRVLGSAPWFPWQHSAAVSLLLKAPDSTLALGYITDNDNAVEDDRLVLRVYVASRRCLWKAIKLVRESDDSVVDELFSHLLDLCLEYKCLSEVTYLPLNALEDAFFCSYLESCPSLRAQELLIMHFALHGHLGEAIALQAKIRLLAMVDPDPGARERSQFRDTLLERYRDTAPQSLAHLWRSLETDPEPPPSPRPHPSTRVKNPPLSSVLAKSEAATKITSSVELVYQAMKQIRDDLATDPVSPVRKNVSNAVPATPFFSHPPSVRKAMWSRRKTSAVQATPVARREVPSRVSTPFHPTPGTASGLSAIRSHMEKFRERMFHMSQTATFDPSIITTPTPMETLTNEMSTAPMPTSILKVKMPGGGEGVRREGGEVGGEGESEATPITRRIRFAEELIPSPTSSLRSGGSPLVTTTTSTASIAVDTPLPSSDDSELFYSFTDSPTVTLPTAPHPPHTLTPSQPHPQTQTQTQLFIGADDDIEEQQEGEQMEGQEDSEQSEDEEITQKEETVAKVTPTSTPQKIQIPFIALAREGIRFRSSPSPGSSPLRGAGAKATPTNPAMKGPGGSGGGLSGLFAPHRPSPLSHSFTSSQSPGRPSPLSRQATSHTTTVQLVGRPETSLSGGLGRPKTSSLSRKINEPSATMVPVLALSQTEEVGEEKMEEEEKKVYQLSSPAKMASRGRPPVEPLQHPALERQKREDITSGGGRGGGGGGGSQFRFSPGKIVSVTPPSWGEGRGVAGRPEFVFSPPFTRSAARRAAEAKRTGLGEGEGEETKKKRPTASGRPCGVAASSHVHLVTPPSQPATPTTTAAGGQRSRHKVTTRAVTSRSSRSTRLVQERKTLF